MSEGYAFGQWERALRQVAAAGDAAGRARAAAKARRWRAVLDGLASGEIVVGSRTPVADTPAWVTLEVAHGGFATGRYLSEVPLRADETARVRALPADSPGTTDRERLNLHALTDAGQAELLDALRSGDYRVELPEDAALPVVAWLLEQRHYEAALDLVAALRPLMHRLRMTPRLAPAGLPEGELVRLSTVGEVKSALREVEVPPQIATMLDTLRVWNPLHDRLVALWCDTVDGDLPHHADGAVAGGWPCQVWPADWSDRRAALLADYATARVEHPRDLPAKGNAARLLAALRACPADSSALTGRQVGWVRRALANSVTAHGAPHSERRAALRATQAATAAHPTHAALARVLAARLDRYPDDGGLPAVDPLAAPVTDGEGVPAGHPIPPGLLAKANRALEAPVGELVDRGLIPSGEVLARVLPQITARLVAADVGDPHLSTLYGRAYAAFRRRRGLLLLNLEHQVRFTELPWIGALDPLRAATPDTTRAARRTLTSTALLTLTAFPQTIPPNPLVRELGTLAKQADVPMPLVEEVAADIFTGAFTTKWRDAAAIASRLLEGTLYARYYDLPTSWPTPRPRKVTLRWGKPVAADFADLCALRAREAKTGKGSFVAANGTVLEQSQILTTHNLAALVDTLGLEDQLRTIAPELADRTLAWVARKQNTRQPTHHATLLMLKNTAYAWRQALFFLSFCTEDRQRESLATLRALPTPPRFGPAIDGLAHTIDGGRFTPDAPGRRFLGWTTGPHWLLATPERPLGRSGD